MIEFIETIKIENGVASNIELHKERLFNTVKFHYGQSIAYNIDKEFEQLLASTVNSHKNNSTIQKLRVIYSSKILNFEIAPYTPKPIKSLKLVSVNEINYKYKYKDRSIFNSLLELKAECDDILICCNNKITDTSFSNVVFKNKNGYFTPNSFLLNGTKRQQLLKQNLIKEADININNYKDYEQIILINAMLPFSDEKTISVSTGIIQ